MKVFQDCIVVLEFDTLTSYKEKTQWRKKVTENGGIVSYVLTKRVGSKLLKSKTYQLQILLFLYSWQFKHGSLIWVHKRTICFAEKTTLCLLVTKCWAWSGSKLFDYAIFVHCVAIMSFDSGELLWSLFVWHPAFNFFFERHLLNHWSKFKNISQDCSPICPLPKLHKWFQSAKQEGITCWTTGPNSK